MYVFAASCLSQGPHSHIILKEEGGGGPRNCFGSEILAKRGFWGSIKDAGDFLGREKKTGIFLDIVQVFHQLKSTIT